VEGLASEVAQLPRSLDRMIADIEAATEAVRDGSRGPLATVRNAVRSRSK
jgi:hypothetical protein